VDSGCSIVISALSPERTAAACGETAGYAVVIDAEILISL